MPMMPCCCQNLCGGCHQTAFPYKAPAPANYQIVISGVSPCNSGCINFSTGNPCSVGTQYFNYISGDINGTYCATFDAAHSSSVQCQWTATLSSPIVFDIYGDANIYSPSPCSLFVSRITISTISIRATYENTLTNASLNACTGTDFKIFAGVDNTYACNGGFFCGSTGGNQTISAFLFARPYNATTLNCVDGTYSNEATCGFYGYCTLPIVGGTGMGQGFVGVCSGGTATITSPPNGC